MTTSTTTYEQLLDRVINDGIGAHSHEGLS